MAMRRRDVYLKIQKLDGYSPVMPAAEDQQKASKRRLLPEQNGQLGI